MFVSVPLQRLSYGPMRICCPFMCCRRLLRIEAIGSLGFKRESCRKRAGSVCESDGKVAQALSPAWPS